MRADLFGYGDTPTTLTLILVIDTTVHYPISYTLTPDTEPWLYNKLRDNVNVPTTIFEYIIRTKLNDQDKKTKLAILFDLGLLNITEEDPGADQYYVIISDSTAQPPYPHVIGTDTRCFPTRDDAILYVKSRKTRDHYPRDYYIASEPDPDIPFNKITQGTPISYLQTY